MTHSDEYWRNIVARFADMNREIAQADVNHIWSYGQPVSGATGLELQMLNGNFSSPVCEDYRKLLSITNGWDGFYHDVDLFGTGEFPSGNRLGRAWEIVEAADEGSGGILAIDRRRHLPIAAARFDIDVFLLELGERCEAVRWIAGQEIERFESVSEFVEAMLSYNETTLVELRANPWLGADS